MKTKDITPNTGKEAWDFLIKEMGTGKVIEINEEIYDYFLEILPPYAMIKGGFIFVEGWDNAEYFFRKDGKYYMKKLKTVVSREDVFLEKSLPKELEEEIKALIKLVNHKFYKGGLPQKVVRW